MTHVMRIALVLLLLWPASGCDGKGYAPQCDDDDDCFHLAGGRCGLNKPTQHSWCQAPDDTCDSGWRWRDGEADGLFDLCVEDGTPVDGGA